MAENLYLCSNVWKALRLLCTFRSIIFFKSGLLSQNIGRSVIFNFLKKLLKKTKFWQKNRSFTFTPEVKVYPLIDSSMMLCNQPRLELAAQLISLHASIFLGIIILGMNKPRPWKCPWTSSKKRKKRSRKENTAMSERNNRPFHSCVLSYLAMNASEAGGDLALIQTSLLFSCKCQLVSIRTTWFAQ